MYKETCRFVHVALFTPGSRPSPPSGAAAALVRGPFADAALGTLGIAHGAAGAAGAAALLAGGAFTLFAFAGAGTCAGSTCGTGAVGIHGERKRRLGSRDCSTKDGKDVEGAYLNRSLLEYNCFTVLC